MNYEKIKKISEKLQDLSSHLEQIIQHNLSEQQQNDLAYHLILSEKKPSHGLSKKTKSNIVKKARAGKDIGKKGKGFKKVRDQAKKYGARDPDAVAAAAMWKNIPRK